MLGVPALVAGCENTLLCTPPNKEQLIAPEIAYAAENAASTRSSCVVVPKQSPLGGTDSVPQVDKIFGRVTAL